VHEESWLDPADECCHEELQPAAPLALQPNLLAPSPAAELRPAALGVDPAALAVWVLLRALQTTVVRQALTEPLGIRALFLPASPHPPQDRMPVPAQTAGLGSAAATCSECSTADRRTAPASPRRAHSGCERVPGQLSRWSAASRSRAGVHTRLGLHVTQRALSVTQRALSVSPSELLA
jgi:hypothetical protein